MYEVALLPGFNADSYYWEIVQESLLTEGKDAKYHYRLFLVIGRGFVQFIKRLAGIERDRMLILEQIKNVSTTKVQEKQSFQLYVGNKDGDDDQESRVAFEGVNIFLKMLLSSGKDDISEEVLQDLIKPFGPVAVEDALKILIRENMAGAITRELIEEYLDAEDEDGEDLLHFATKEGKKMVVSKLISVLKSVKSDTKAKEKLDRNNTAGDSPLAIAARLGHFSVVVTLLLENADPNCINRRSGYTPLHYASENGHREVVQALLVFGADPQLKNEEGKSPSDLTKSSEVVLLFQQIKSACVVETIDHHCKYNTENLDPDCPLVLSIDGGGIRGLAAAMVLCELEDRVRALDPKCETLSSYFDYMSGTSTGSFITLLLSHGNRSMTEIIKLYFRFKDDILPLDRPFPQKVVNDAIKEVFGDKVFMADKDQTKVMVMTCKADVSPPILHIMRNYGEPQDGEVGPTERKVWEAARASSAAPTYFPAFGKFLDGGLMANNPTVDCIGEVIDDLIAQDKNPRLGLVVSIGTGNSPRSAIGDVDIPNVNWLDPTDIIDAALSLKNFLKLVIDQVTVSGGRQVERSISWCASMNCPFFRLNPPLEKEIDLAAHENEIVIDMMFQALIYAKNKCKELDTIAKILCRKAELSRTH